MSAVRRSDGPPGGARRTAAPAPHGLQVLPVTGLPEFRPGDDLAAAVAAAAPWLRDGDVLLVTSKVVSKVEGRLLPSPADPEERDRLRRNVIDEETVRLVAQSGRTRIVENRLGHRRRRGGRRRLERAGGHHRPAARRSGRVRGPAAGRLRRARAGRRRASITDTQGRAWRIGVTDVAIGAAGVRVLDDHRGGRDAHGNELVITQVAVGDELAAAGDLVKGKLAGVPVAVARGLAPPPGTAPGGDAGGADRAHAAATARRGPVPAGHRPGDRAGPAGGRAAPPHRPDLHRRAGRPGRARPLRRDRAHRTGAAPHQAEPVRLAARAPARR